MFFFSHKGGVGRGVHVGVVLACVLLMLAEIVVVLWRSHNRVGRWSDSVFVDEQIVH